MQAADERAPVSVGVLLAVGVVVALTSVGFAQGWWWPNAHNGLLALAFTLVGAYVLHQRPGHRAGRWFVAAGLLHGVMFAGRQLGRTAGSDIERWAAWIGVFPIAISIAAVTICIFVFPDGRLSSARWRIAAIAMAVVAGGCSLISALWPVEYEDAHVVARPPFVLDGFGGAEDVWSAVAHPAYFAFQLSWVVALAWRWRASHGAMRRQVTWLAIASGVSIAALIVGLAVWGSPRAGVVSAALLPLAAGWSIVHGHFASARHALSWQSRTRRADGDLLTGLCEAAANATAAPSAELWIGDVDELTVIGRWPDDEYGESRSAATLADDPSRQTRLVTRGDQVIGAVSVARPRIDPLSRSEDTLLDSLVSQAVLVIENLSLAAVVDRERAAGHLAQLTPRENEVLELMARGFSNAAICDQLHVSIKTVEPTISTIFMKLGLHADAASNRRVLAVLAYLRQ